MEPTSTANDENQAPQKSAVSTRKRTSLLNQNPYSQEQIHISEKILMESASEKDRISMPKVNTYLKILIVCIFTVKLNLANKFIFSS